MCPVCGSPAATKPCGRCRADPAPAPVRRLPSGLLVRSAMEHRGAARQMVHRLKYAGTTAMAGALAVPMAALVPGAAQALVPVPRAPLRVWRYGVDPAAELAAAVAAITGLPVVRSLRGPPWWPHHAGRKARARPAPGFRRAGPVGPGMVLVDDVLTTGATLDAAARALGGAPIGGLTATAAGTLTVRDTDRTYAPGEAGWR